MPVTVVRGGVPESRHEVHVAVSDASGRLLAWHGDPDRPTTMRSSAKPLQADPLVQSGAVDELGIDDETLAVCCASHGGLDVHVAAVERGLAAAGLTAEALRNATGAPEQRLRHNCSGNHLGFLANSVHHGWDTATYRSPEHPSQRAALGVIAELSGLEAESIPTMTDGCGVVAFALPLRVIAGMYARLPETLPRQFAAMTAHPELVRGDGDFDTEVMRSVAGCVAKGGAEGLSSIGLANEGIGIAIRIDDGNSRASAPAAIAVMRQLLGWNGDLPTGLGGLAEPVFENCVGDPIVRLRADIALA